MKLRTEVQLPSYPEKFDHKNFFLTLGSCFSEEIGKKLVGNGFHTISNPFGTIYNPKILELISGNLAGIEIPNWEQSIIERNEAFFSLFFHSQLNGSTPQEFQSKFNGTTENVRMGLQTSPVVLLTLGTSKVYAHIETGIETGNCHKIPSSQFNPKWLSKNEIEESLKATIRHFRIINKQTPIIITISPVRHLADGLLENQRSKASLILAAHSITKLYDDVHYFPSYELIMDDLRDYRFYKEDLIHPNDLATQYIWGKFSSSFLSEESIKLGLRISKIKSSIHHKPFFPGSKEHIKFLHTLLRQAESKDLQPFLKKEIREIKSLLS